MAEGVVYFVGAGPGDPNLITVKGKGLIERADVILYADSLVNPALCSWAKEGTEVQPSSRLTLEEIGRIMVSAARQGKLVVRLHSGDPSIYSAILEHMALLDRVGVRYAASLGVELTVPEVAQSLIISRIAGRTPVPEKESLEALASHGTTLALFLSVGQIDEVVQALAGGYPPETPVAVVYRASWPQERVIRGRLADIAQAVKESGINKQALILVGKALDREADFRSRLYDKAFSHQYRKAQE